MRVPLVPCLPPWVLSRSPLIPALKYPANPPSVGDGETLGVRTAPFFGMIALSLAAMIAAGMLRSRLRPPLGGWNAFLIAVAAYLVIILGVSLALPSMNEVPEQFPAIVLWRSESHRSAASSSYGPRLAWFSVC